jgi:hypothetical protein
MVLCQRPNATEQLSACLPGDWEVKELIDANQRLWRELAIVLENDVQSLS